MLLSRELLGHQLRQLCAREWCKRNSVRALSIRDCWPSPHQGSRHVGGEETSSGTNFSGPTPCSASRVSLASTTYVVPMFQVWMRLNSFVPQSKPSNVLRTMRRFRLEQQPLLQNLRQAVSMRWRRFYGSSHLAQRLFERATQAGKRSWAVAKESRMAKIQNFVFSMFMALSEKLESALSPASLGLNSVTESAAMEIISLSSIYKELNSAAIEYILNNDECTEDQVNQHPATG